MKNADWDQYHQDHPEEIKFICHLSTIVISVHDELNLREEVDYVGDTDKELIDEDSCSNNIS